MILGDGALLLLKPRDMGIAEHRHAIRAHADDLVDGIQKALRRLQREAINQIDVDGLKSERAGTGQKQPWSSRTAGSGGLIFLHVRIEILNAHGNPVESQPAQRGQLVFPGYARIDLNADFRIRGKAKAFFGVKKQVLELGGAEIGGCAASPVKLDHRPRSIDIARAS